ncbi:ABC transporter substrate-binding protein [Bradyrhizobium sp. 136]|uniref:ABC transporter substrate-binding protein n=1 Tax=Bradyrhizobium sp. 136 TaxID=2782613 RepID=UPI001FF7D8BB|nr:ABC transporter substrate-binding protein [Bradyrhizobium sp. 136]
MFAITAQAAGAEEIRIGSLAATDAASPAAVVARVTSAYFNRINQNGGVAGHQIRLISYDHGGDPKKALDLTRKLFEEDHVSLLTGLDRKTIDAAAPYIRFKQVPLMYESQDEIADEAALKAATLGEYILNAKPDGKIAIIFETGKSVSAVDGFFYGLGAANARRMITNMLRSDEWTGNRVARVSGSSADFLAVFGSRAFQSDTMKQTVGLEWKPTLAITDQLGLAPAEGAISAMVHLKPIELTDDETLRWQRFKDELEPSDAASDFAIEGFLQAQSLTRILKQCETDLSSACLRRTYASEKDMRTEHIYVSSIARFDGTSWIEPTPREARAYCAFRGIVSTDFSAS